MANLTGKIATLLALLKPPLTYPRLEGVMLMVTYLIIAVAAW